VNDNVLEKLAKNLTSKNHEIFCFDLRNTLFSQHENCRKSL
jgi:hypothetical protein